MITDLLAEGTVLKVGALHMVRCHGLEMDRIGLGWAGLVRSGMA